MTMPGRTYNAGSVYRYGFNGKENDKDIFNEDDAYDFDNRIYNPSLVHWLSLDKLQAKRPGESPYLFCGASPIIFMDPDGKDRIITTNITRYLADGNSITLTITKVIKGLDTYQKTQIYDAHGKPTGKYEYRDIYETHNKIYNSEGKHVGGSDSYVFGKTVQFISDNDLDTKWGRFVEGLSSNPRKEGHRKGGGGIVFTSKYGQGGGPTADFTDAQIENLDVLMDAFSATGQVADYKSMLEKMKSIFTRKGIDKSEMAQFLIKKVQDAIKIETITAKKGKTDDEVEFPIGSDSCGLCHKVLPAGTMSSSPTEEYHTEKLKTKSTNKVKQ